MILGVVIDEPASGWFTLGAVVGGAITWFVTLKKHQAETKKILREDLKLEGDNLRQWQEAKRDHTARCAAATKCAEALTEAIRDAISPTTDAEDNNLNEEEIRRLRTLRREFCAAVIEGVIPAYEEFVRWEELDCRSEPKDRQQDDLKRLIKEHVIPELERYIDWLRVANLNKLLELTCGVGAFVEKRNLDRFRRLARNISPSDPIDWFKKIDEVIAQFPTAKDSDAGA